MVAEFLINPIFKFGVLPIGSAILGVGLKYISRNDQYARFTKEDIAVGLELALTACLIFVVLTTDKAVQLVGLNEELANVLSNKPIDTNLANDIQTRTQLLSGQIADSGWLIAILFLGLISISTIVRKWGWESETSMKPIVGITIPLIFGILAIIGVMASATK